MAAGAVVAALCGGAWAWSAAPAGPAAPPAAQARIAAASNDFGFNLLRELGKKEAGKNLFLSPYSLAVALSMTANGANGATREAMLRTLRLQGMSLEEINQAHAELRAGLADPAGKIQLATANSIWIDQGFHFRPDFLRRNEASYEAQVTSLNFADPRSLRTINGWVDRQTRGKIPEIVRREDLTPMHVAVLLNAVYFKGTWAVSFPRAATRERDFTLADGRCKKCPMMTNTAEYSWMQGDGFQAVQLPYSGGGLSMLILLPDAPAGLEPLRRRLTAATWQQWVGRLQAREVHLTLPRFKVEYEAEMREALTALGMGVAFDRFRADFTGMISSPRVSIDKVRHKTYVDVNEEGTEAAAATMVSPLFTSLHTLPVEVVVDHPFLCAIRDNKNGALLFLGAIHDPTSPAAH
jgi:serine protease inhibitor